MSQSASVSESTGNPILDYFRGFEVLRETRREFWALQGVTLLDMFSYFALTNIIIVMLSEKFGFNDVHAGYVWMGVSAFVSITMFFTGAWTDALGIRWSLCVALLGNIVGRGGVLAAALVPEAVLQTFTRYFGFDAVIRFAVWCGAADSLNHRAVLAALSLLVLAPFLGMTATVYQAGNRRFTSARARSAGFNLWYLVMNIGALTGSVIIDVIRLELKWDTVQTAAFGAVCCALGFVLAISLIRNESQVYGPDEAIEPPAPPRRRGVLSGLSAVITTAVFWRFVLLVALLVPVRAIFIYLHSLYPKYWLRVIGPDAWIGTLQGINPALVILGLIILIPLVKKAGIYSMLMYGALISTLSLFAMAIPAWGQTAYLTSLAALLVLSVGEIIWSPRLYDYTASIAPRGQEGVYYGFSALPWFVAKTIANGMSGHMLHTYIPEYPAGEPILADRLAAGKIPFTQSPSMLFLILGGITLMGPVLGLLLRGFFTKGARLEEPTPKAA